MRGMPMTEDHFLRFGAALSSLVFFASAGLSFELARDHMAALGAICGAASAPHCGWCFGAAGLAIAGLAAAVHAVAGNRNTGLFKIKAARVEG